MYISQIRLNSKAASMGLPKAINENNLYSLHQLIWSLFNSEKRNFLFRMDHKPEYISFIVVSNIPPQNPTKFWEIETKPYHPKLHQHQTLLFKLRANPIKTKKTSDKKRKRHDVVMEMKKELKFKKSELKKPLPYNQIIQRSGYKWLQDRMGKHGFHVKPEEVRIDGYLQHIFQKRKHSIKISTLEFTGKLTVQDPVKFSNTLIKGMGPAKGFGCGLLLVKNQ